MKRVLFPLLLCVVAPCLQAQTITNVKTTGNVLTSSDKIGSTNDEDVTFMTNGQNHLILKKNGNLRLVSFDNGLTGFVTSNANGVFNKVSFTGSANDVLNGTGVFAPLNTLTGWTLSGAKLTTGKRVGINVANPTKDLEISGDALISGTLYVGNIESIEVVNANKRIDFKTAMSMTGYDPAEGTRNAIWTNNDHFYLNSQDGINNNTIINDSNDGRVAIGTTNPQAKLHVKGNALVQGLLRADTINIGDSLTIRSGSLGGMRSFLAGPVGGTSLNVFPPCISKGSAHVTNLVNGFTLAHATDTEGNSGELVTGHNGTKAIVESFGTELDLNYYCGRDVGICRGPNGGNVFLCNESNGGGVGIASSYIPNGYKLAVNGKLIAEDIRVKLRSTWPDYVFDSARVLTPLPVVAQFVQEHHHLPGIPSAEEIQEKGFDAGEMVRLQMEKIEELTLHIIELEKRINELEKHK